MKANKTIMMLVLAGVLAGCSSSGRNDDAPVGDQTPVDDTPTRPVVDTVPSDPYDGMSPTDPRQINNPNSLLSQRVILFDFDQSTVRPEYRDVVAAHAALLRANPTLEATLEGHADERGTREYNLGLGERRGNSISRVLDAGGASGAQVNVVSYGEERPALTCSSESCWSQNRRVEIVYRQ